MAGAVFTSQPPESFEFELFEGDPDHLRTVVATVNQIGPWISPSALKLRHRIGRGPLGDVWLATHHHSAEDYDEYHEVAVKMLHPVKEDHMKAILEKFNELFTKCKGLKSVCFLHGISIISGKICIVMKFYEGSVGDKMSRLKGGKLSLPDVIRYGINLAEGILELHSQGILVLNLKPFNFLLSENEDAIIGDVGIPYLLLGTPLASPDAIWRLGTPNYMAPEQWQPEVRGPISFETDSWGFGCSIVEMLTGLQPWPGKLIEEIYHSVVIKQEKPNIPGGLPSAVENVLLGCFLYDFRSRPLMSDILHAFKSSQDAIYNDGVWTAIGSSAIMDRSSVNGYSEWFLLKDIIQAGDMVRSRKPLNSCKLENMDVPDGVVVGVERDLDHDGFVLVRVHGIHDPLRVHTSTLERVTFGLAAGDWVCLKEDDRKNSLVGVLHSIDREGNVAVGFLGMETLWKGKSSDIQMAEHYHVGQFVRLKASVLSPRFEWPRKMRGSWAAGRIKQVLPNGCLIVKFPGIMPFANKCSDFLADPAEVEAVSFGRCSTLAKKCEHLEDFHWAVRPLLIALGLFTAVKLGLFAGKKMGKSKVRRGQVAGEGEGQSAGNPAWFRPAVANILFKDGPTASLAR